MMNADGAKFHPPQTGNDPGWNHAINLQGQLHENHYVPILEQPLLWVLSRSDEITYLTFQDRSGSHLKLIFKGAGLYRTGKRQQLYCPFKSVLTDFVNAFSPQ